MARVRVFVNGREKDMLQTLHHDQLVKAAFGDVPTPSACTVSWGLASTTGKPVKSIGGLLLPGGALDLADALKYDSSADAVSFDVRLPG